MRVCEINFGGEIGTRPAIIMRDKGNSVDVLKITTKSRATDGYSKFRLSGFSGVKGCVVTNILYTVPKENIIRYTNSLFPYEEKEVFTRMKKFNYQGKLQKVEIINKKDLTNENQYVIM